MDKNSEKKEKILHKISFVVIFIALSWWGLDEYLRINSPRVPNQEQGRIYEKDYHGTIIYLNLTEYILEFALPGIGFSIFIYLMIVQYFAKKK